MSITGSLVGYENNNDMNSSSKKNRSLLNTSTTSTSSKQCISLNSSISNSIITTSSSTSAPNCKHKISKECQLHQKNSRSNFIHLNSLWSIWYGVLATLLQGYLVLKGAYTFLGCSLIQWKNDTPYTELNIQIYFCGFVLLLLPLFILFAVFKVGNLANDGIKLPSGSGKCSIEPQDGLEVEAKGGTLRALWTHGGPTSAFTHIVIALCLLLPRLLLEARLIDNGKLTKGKIWSTELDYMLANKNGFVVLSFMTSSPYQNITNLDEISITNLKSDNSINYINTFEKTHLIEKFHSSDYDTDLFDTHEKIEMELSSSAQITTDQTYSTHSDLIKLTRDDGMETNVNSLMITTNTASYTAGNKGVNSKTGTIPPSTTSSTTGINTNRQTKHNIDRYVTGVGTSGQSTGKKHSNKIELNRKQKEDGDRLTSGSKRERNNRKNVGRGIENPGRSNNGSDVDGDKEYESKNKGDDVESDDLSTVDVMPNRKKNQKSHHHHHHQKDGNGVVRKNGMNGNKKNSEIHIVRSDDTKTGSIVTQIPTSTDSKIIDIKPSNNNNVRKFRRSPNTNFDVESNIEINEPKIDLNFSGKLLKKDTKQSSVSNEAYLTDSISFENSSEVMNPIILSGFPGYLQKWLHVYKEIDMTAWNHTPSLEYLNFCFAIMVWSVRYPAVFWQTSKPFAIIFSLQMIANGVDIILGYNGISILYKLQIVGQSSTSLTLLLNAIVTLSLYILSLLLIIASALILYLYGHGRLSSRIRDRRMVSTKSNDSWVYFAHCASLCFVLALAVVKAPVMHDLSAIYQAGFNGAILVSALSSVIHLLLWIVLWLGLTAKRRWHFKLPPLQLMDHASKSLSATQPLLMPRIGQLSSSGHAKQVGSDGGDQAIYWPKLTPNSPKLKVTFNEVPSTLNDLAEHDGKRNTGRRTSVCMSPIAGEADDGDYATLRGPTCNLLQLADFGANCDMADDTSEEGKLLACVRDDSVTYASTRNLEPPCHTPPLPDPPTPPPFIDEADEMISPLAPVTVTVHTNEAHISSSLTPRCLRRADSGVPNEVLTPRSETTSTESSTSPPERAPSETSSGVHSGEERDEVVIRARPAKTIVKPPQPVIQEEPFGRSTNMKMSSFNITNLVANKNANSSSTLPLTRALPSVEQCVDFNTANHCSTMPLPLGYHQQYHQQFRSPMYASTSNNISTKHQLHTTLPNGVRYANPLFLRRAQHVKNAESPYGILGLGAGHHTFSKLIQDPLSHCVIGNHPTIQEDRDSANYSMTSEPERDIYGNSGSYHHMI